jgi:plasmid stabilization system protein ParE
MRVLLTRRAEISFLDVKTYIEKKFGDSTASQFVEKVNDLFNLLKVYPKLGPVEKKTSEDFNCHANTCVVSNQRRYYNYSCLF